MTKLQPKTPERRVDHAYMVGDVQMAIITFINDKLSIIGWFDVVGKTYKNCVGDDLDLMMSLVDEAHRLEGEYHEKKN